MKKSNLFKIFIYCLLFVFSIFIIPITFSKYTTTLSKSITVNARKPKYTVNFYPNRLPEEYQEVEYLESTGTQYIDTGVIPDSNTGFYLDFTLLDSVDNNGKRLLGTSYRNNGDWGGVMISSWNWSAGGQMNYMQRSRSYNPGLVTNTRMQISLINRHYQSSTGTNIEFQTGSLRDIYGSIYLLNVNTDMFNSNGSSAIIYSAKIYDGNNEIRNYIPCYRKADNKPGLYDLVNGEFYTNQGTGTFSKGNDVEYSLGTMSNQQFTYGTAQNLTANTYTREGYKFTGWNTEADGSGTSYEDEEEVLNLSSTDGDEIDLYAQWEEINHYTVNFYSNTGRLPEEYQEVEYIESTGTQWIDTGFNPNPKTTRVETTFQVTDNTKINQRLFGARKSYSDGETICNIFWNSQKMGNAFRVDWVGNASTVSSKFSLNTDITIVSENNKVIINDLEEYTSTTSKSDSYLDFPIYINNFTSNGQLEDNQQPAYAKWKTFKIYDNGTLVRDFVPCYRKNDNEIGLYDIVNKVFYTNSGAGTFSKGDDVEGLSGTMSSQQFTYGIAQKLLANTYTKEGYTFTGWNTKPDGTGISYTDEQEVNNLTADNNGTVTLYAQWN